MLAAGTLAVLLLATLPVQVESAACPAGAEVEHALASRLAPAADGAGRDHARIWREQGVLHVELVNPAGAIIAERTLDDRGTCTDLAALLAVVIASWESDVHPAFASPPEPNAAPTVTRAAPARTKEIAAASLDLALGGGAAWGGGATLALSASATFIPFGTGLGARVAALTTRERDLSLGQGRVTWTRWTAGADLDWRQARGRLTFDAHAGLLLGSLSVAGANFPRNASQTSRAAGVAVGARLSWWASRYLAVWLDLGMVSWLRKQTVYSAADQAERQVPAWEAIAQLGVAVGKTARPR